MKRTLVVPDVHGKFDDLKALLVQEGVVDPKTERRINHDVEVVQLGDLGDFGRNGPTGDLLCYRVAEDWFDVVLWGNHDRAVVDSTHAFNHQEEPRPETLHILKLLAGIGHIRFAHAAHGWLITHAGLAKYFTSKACAHPLDTKTDGDLAEYLAHQINHRDHRDPIFQAISGQRGGRYPYGGILWRHAGEKLNSKVNQIFGHTSGKKVRKYQSKGSQSPWSYCIDTGKKGRFGAMWLPEERFAEVGKEPLKPPRRQAHPRDS